MKSKCLLNEATLSQLSVVDCCLSARVFVTSWDLHPKVCENIALLLPKKATLSYCISE